jgi:hypothetical protein
MSILVPSLAETSCVFFTACASVESADEKILSILASDDAHEFCVGDEDAKRYVRVFFGGGTGRHCHIDVAPSSYFEGNPPKTTKPQGEFDAVMSPLFGCTVKVRNEGTFVMSPGDAPRLVALLRGIRAEHDGVGLELVGGQLKVKGAPVNFIDWQFKERKDAIEVTIRGERKTQINEDYLVDGFKIVNTAFVSFKREGIPSGNSSQSV